MGSLSGTTERNKGALVFERKEPLTNSAKYKKNEKKEDKEQEQEKLCG